MNSVSSILMLLTIGIMEITPGAALPIKKFSNPNITSSMMIKSQLVVRTQNASFKEECFVWCFSLTKWNITMETEVCSIETVTDRFSVNLQCKATQILSKYFVVFPMRYLVINGQDNLKSEIYYRTDRNLSTFQQVLKPLIFFALDDVSGGTNLGSLDWTRYRVDFANVAPRFDCQWSGSTVAEGTKSGPKLLRVVPSDKPFNQFLHNGTLSMIGNTAGLTITAWFKKGVPASTAPYPILDFWKNDNVTMLNYMWIWPGYDTLEMLYSGSYVRQVSVISVNDWNNFGLLAINSNMEMWINSTLKGTSGITTSSVNLGENIFIVTRVVGPEIVYLDGCIGHLLMFSRYLPPTELKLYVDLVTDPFF